MVETNQSLEGKVEEKKTAGKVGVPEEILDSKEDAIGEKYEVKNDKLDLPGDDDVRSKKRKGQGQGRVVMKEMGLTLGFLNFSPHRVDAKNERSGTTQEREVYNREGDFPR